MLLVAGTSIVLLEFDEKIQYSKNVIGSHLQPPTFSMTFCQIENVGNRREFLVIQIKAGEGTHARSFMATNKGGKGERDINITVIV